MVAAAAQVSIYHRPGAGGRSLTGDRVDLVTSPLDNCIVLIEGNGESVCIVALNAGSLNEAVGLYQSTLAGILGIPVESVVLFVSHNHCDVEICARGGASADDSEGPDLTEAGARLLDSLSDAARTLRGKLTQVTVRYGMGRCDSISYNRKGRRHDGTTYFMREEDRVELGADYSGEIDPDAPVITLIDTSERPVCHLVSFTAHPVTAYHPETPIVAGEYSQTASRILSEWTGGAPVAFIQGCAGDTNSKHFLTAEPPVEKTLHANLYGVRLGAAFVSALEASTSASDSVGFERRMVELPMDTPPAKEEVAERIAEIEAFFARCDAGDEDTLTCAGLNASRTMSPRYRSSLLKPVYRWYRWVESLGGGTEAPPKPAEVDLVTVRIGDASIVGLGCEPFSTIGLAIKRDSPAAITLTGGYLHDFGSIGYIPDGQNHRDLDYVSSFYRYLPDRLPYADPAGDRLANEAIGSLNRLFDR